MFQYHNQHKFVSELINNGEIGELRAFRSCFGFSDINNFRYSKQLGGGALLDVGGYTIKACSLFLGNSLEIQSSVLNYDLSKCEVDLYGPASLSNKEGVIGQIAFGFDNYYRCDYELWGSKGKITAKKAFTPKPEFKPQIILEKNDQTTILSAPSDDHFLKSINEFGKILNSKKFENAYEELLTQSKLQQNLKIKALETE